MGERMADQTDLDEERRVRVEQLMADEGLSWGEAWKLSEPEFTGAEYLSPTLWPHSALTSLYRQRDRIATAHTPKADP
jgi:hypothetical protein